MATLRDIRQRIHGVKKTQQITNAMKMVAAAKLRKAQNKIISARPYAYELADMLSHLVREVDVSLNPLLKPREVKNIALVVVTADRGLCGGFNTNILRRAALHISNQYAEEQREGNLKVICIGRKGYDYFRRRDYTIHRHYIGLFGNLNFPDAQRIVEELKDDYLNGVFDKIEIIYNEFKSVVLPRISIEQFLPIPPKAVADERESRVPVDYIYEPSAEEIVNKLIPKHLDTHFWRVLLESNAAEEGSRMAAMDAATENARDLIRTLNLTYNKARQAAITTELMEIVGGSNALKEAG